MGLFSAVTILGLVTSFQRRSIIMRVRAHERHVIAEKDLEGLIFDCDGTLVDTTPAYWSAWVKTCKQFNLDFSERRFFQLGGVPVRDIVETLVNDSIQKPDIDQVYQTKKRNAMIAMEEIGTPGIACVIEIVKKYHGKIPMAVASSGVKTHVEKSLRDNGIYDLFDAVVTSEDVTNPKPAPDIFLEAARRINCNPKNCRGFEDSGLGLRALAKAGMEVVDVRKLENYPKRHASDVSVLDEKYKFPKF